MRRQLILVIVGTAIVISVIAGFGTWYLARQSARNGAVEQVHASAQTFEERFPLPGGLEPAIPKGANARTAIRVVRTYLRLLATLSKIDGATLVYDTRLSSNPPHLAPGLDILERAAAAGRAGRSTVSSGSTGPTAWAVAPTTVSIVITGRTVVRPAVLVLTRRIGTSNFSGDFLVIGGAVIAFAIVMALALSRRITRPLRRAVAVTGRIAHGDLGARVGVHRGEVAELSSLARSIDAMAEGLSGAKDAERQFLLSVSHDLRTPLTSIRGYAEAILDGTVPDPRSAAVVIVTEAGRLERLVADLLDLAKLDAHTFSFHVRTVEVSEVIDEVAEELRPLVDDAGLTLVVVPSAHPAYAQVDPDRLDQVLANLVENAAKYARSTIRLGTIAHATDALLVVEDDGPGIPAEEIGRIFDRHFSADRHARPGRPRGSGLGLAIAAELSAAMGARLVAESPILPAGGTRMSLQLPTVGRVGPSQNPHSSHIAP